MDAEAASPLNLIGPAHASTASDEELLKPEAPKPFDCKGTDALVTRLEKEGLKRLDINIGKTRKMIKQDEEGKKDADKELAKIAGEAAAGKLADVMKDFAANQKTIAAMEKQLQKLTAGTSVMNADKEKLKAWIEHGIDAGNTVLDTYETAKKAKEVDFTVKANESRKEQL